MMGKIKSEGDIVVVRRERDDFNFQQLNCFPGCCIYKSTQEAFLCFLKEYRQGKGNCNSTQVIVT